MRARRALREQITTQVQGFLQRPPSTLQTQYKFVTIAVICILASMGSGVLAYASFESFISLAQDSQRTFRALAETIANTLQSPAPAETPPTTVPPSPDNAYVLWMLALRGAVLTAVAVGFAAYLLSMVRKSHDFEVQTLHELQRYGMDINRASWVIETAMEMTTKEGAALPEEWIRGACAGLFQNGSKKDGEVSSLAALGAVMGLGPEVNIGPTGASFKLPPKSAKKAANEADTAE